MKKALLFVFAMVLSFGMFAQSYGKLTPAMQQELEKRTGADEQFRIIIGMAEKYDQAQMSRSIQNMNSDERRAYVINELSNFSAASQADLLRTLNDGAKAGIVEKVTPFWIFNGVSCITNREMIYTLAKRTDIAYIESDEMRNMLPEASLELKKQSLKVENPQPVQTSRDGATSIAWNVTQVHADQVWSQYNINGSGVIIAVIDTGVNYGHPDLADHMWDGGTEYPYHGYDFVNTDNDPMDDNGHGSHCAGTVAGNGASGIQTGMAPGTTIMALKVLSAKGSGSTSNITSAMTFAIEHGANAVSMSLGGHGTANNATSLSASERDAMVTMLNSGVVALVAAGNEGEYYNNHHTQPSSVTGGASTTWYEVPWNVGNPGNCPSPWRHPDQTLDGGHTAVITIGASNRNDRKSTFSSFGPCTWKGKTFVSSNGYDDYDYDEDNPTGSTMGLIKPDIIVPGSDITSCLFSYNTPSWADTAAQYTTPYVAECGTSMATPGAAGITALVIQAWRNKHNNVNPTPAQIDEILEITAYPVDFRDTKNNTTGAGRADAKAAVDAIYTTATKPGTFQVTNVDANGIVQNGGCVHLSWGASTSADGGYAIWRDNEQVGTTKALTYDDKNPGAGKHTYYVRAIDNAGIQSVRSNAAFCTVQPYAFADDPSITWNGTTATLGWVPTVSNTLASGDLKYINVTSTESAFSGPKFGTAFWGMCFTPEDLRPYQGMSITSVSLAIYKSTLFSVADDDITLHIYRGTQFGNTTGAPVYSQDFSVAQSEQGWVLNTVTLTTPYALSDITQDLWIGFSDINTSTVLGAIQEYPMAIGPYDGPSSNVLYMGSSHNHVHSEAIKDICWSHIPDFGDAYNYALSFECHLERTTTYSDSYDITFQNGSNDATNLGTVSNTNSQVHTPSLASGENTYKVTATVSTGGNVVNTSCPQVLKIVKVDDNYSPASNSDIEIDKTKVYLVQSNGNLNVNTVTNDTEDGTSRLIIEDGGKLSTIENSTPKGTMKKNITAYNDQNAKDHYYMITPPFEINSNNIGASGMLTTNFDLYYFDQTKDKETASGHPEEWQNYEAQTGGHYDLIPGRGYIYANAGGTPIAFAGTLNAAENKVNLVNEPNHNLSGWNFIGNPFSDERYISKSFYRINEAGTAMIANESSAAISPLEGVFVYTETNNEEVTFAKPAAASPANPGQINVELCQAVSNTRGESHNSILDRAIVRFDEGSTLPKFVFNADNAKIYIPQDGKDMAIVNATENGETINAIDLNFKTTKNGTYTLNVDLSALNSQLSTLRLIDHLTGADVDLLLNPSYSFEANVNDYESRFQLVFNNNQNENENDIFVYRYNGNLVVMGASDNATIQVIDALGRVIVTRRDAKHYVSTMGMKPGVYMVRVFDNDNTKVQKIVID